MGKRSVDLCCSECSDDISALCTPWHYLTPSAAARQPTRCCPAPGHKCPDLVSDDQYIREELQMLLLRERQGPEVWNYMPQHNFLTYGDREILVASIINAADSQSYELTTAALAVSILDRFAARQYFQREEGAFIWLAALACLSLAAKLEEIEVPSTIPALQVAMQVKVPWLGQVAGSDVSQMEMLIMKALGWCPTALTAPHFLDQLLYDALSGALFHLQNQLVDYILHAKQHAARVLLNNMRVAMSLMYSASTQACAAVLVAFKALGVKEAALKCLIEEWAHLGILEVLPCFHTTLSHIDNMYMRSAPRPSVSFQFSQTAFNGLVSYSNMTSSDCSQDVSSVQRAIIPACEVESVQQLDPAPLAPFLAPLETASSLSSVYTVI